MSHIKNLTTGSLASTDLMVVGDGTSELKGQTSSTTMMYNTTGSLTTEPNGALIPIHGYPVQQS
jgi:flagellar basal body rod protein FlgG